MFYCNKCGEERKWPTDALLKSKGTCEICNKEAICNDIPSKLLPIPKNKETKHDKNNRKNHE